MFQKTSKFIGMIMVTIVLLGHHSFQAQVMQNIIHQAEEVSCFSHDCHHQIAMEICEKIQSDQMHVSTDFLFVPEISNCSYNVVIKNETTPDEVFENYQERIPLSHKQLARSHL